MAHPSSIADHAWATITPAIAASLERPTGTAPSLVNAGVPQKQSPRWA